MPNFADIGLSAGALNQYGLPDIGYSVPLADVQPTPAFTPTALQPGRITKQPERAMRRELLSPAYTTRWCDLLTTHAKELVPKAHHAKRRRTRSPEQEPGR
ncbi:DUF4113 domain-containing protein [Pseudomonas sp. V1]|uniref:DUF4113 domain-containing protein n=1 Tax=Pseudomonas arcuscaelestis TaxID=2710591 RepID=UPI00193FD498|nr:DUF4113 domain-containing protein [Pseudomonas arcuscaelestis]MBM3105894.1 DUF4113 domain-containing protein [Pseudomonas arcuscaelestis]